MSIPRASWDCPICGFETDYPKAKHICYDKNCPHKGRSLEEGPAKSEPYLIAHLVRGQPVFDIAERIQIGDEEGWIIPTSGHRAYPYWHESLDGIGGHSDVGFAIWAVPSPPPDWPDHYSLSVAPKGQGLITNLAERLGFVPAPPRITRR